MGGIEGANDTVWQMAMRENGATIDARDVQERWLDRRDELDEEERKAWEEETKEMRDPSPQHGPEAPPKSKPSNEPKGEDSDDDMDDLEENETSSNAALQNVMVRSSLGSTKVASDPSGHGSGSEVSFGDRDGGRDRRTAQCCPRSRI